MPLTLQRYYVRCVLPTITMQWGDLKPRGFAIQVYFEVFFMVGIIIMQNFEGFLLKFYKVL